MINEININELSKNKLAKDFYLQNTTQVAKNLIGKILVRKLEKTILAGIIVETEAYLSENDAASHSAPGKTKRNFQMFETGGTLYVYKIYGIHHCINVVTEPEGIGAAVLIRAIQPISGIEKMMKFRNIKKIENLCKGPGNVAKALNIDLKLNGHSLLSDTLFIAQYKEIKPQNIFATERVGITKSANLKLRFLLKNSNFVSGKKN